MHAKNNYSYFLAGYKCGLVRSGKFTPKEIEDLFYTTIEYPNECLGYIWEYDSEKDSEEGMKKIYIKLTNKK